MPTEDEERDRLASPLPCRTDRPSAKQINPTVSAGLHPL